MRNFHTQNHRSVDRLKQFCSLDQFKIYFLLQMYKSDPCQVVVAEESSTSLRSAIPFPFWTLNDYICIIKKKEDIFIVCIMIRFCVQRLVVAKWPQVIYFQRELLTSSDMSDTDRWCTQFQWCKTAGKSLTLYKYSSNFLPRLAKGVKTIEHMWLSSNQMKTHCIWSIYSLIGGGGDKYSESVHSGHDLYEGNPETHMLSCWWSDIELFSVSGEFCGLSAVCSSLCLLFPALPAPQ